MTVRAQLRWISLAPIVFALVGALLVVLGIDLRSAFSPTPGVLAGVIVIVAACVATAQLWRAARQAPVLVVVAGVCLAGAIYALPRFYPLVNASSEPMSLLEQNAFLIALVVVAVLTVAPSCSETPSGRPS